MNFPNYFPQWKCLLVQNNQAKRKITFAGFPAKRICSLYFSNLPHYNSSIFVCLVFSVSCSYPVHSSTPFCKTHRWRHTLCTECSGCPEPRLPCQSMNSHVRSKPNHTEAALKPSLQGHRFRLLCFMEVSKCHKIPSYLPVRSLLLCKQKGLIAISGQGGDKIMQYDLNPLIFL